MEWIKIESNTILSIEHKILFYNEKYNQYETMYFDHEQQDSDGDIIQVWRIWKISCGDTLFGNLSWFDQHILSVYSHYLILDKPEYRE